MNPANVLVDQPTAAPTRKVAAGGIAGAVSIVALYLVQALFNVTVPAEVASAVTLILSFGMSYIVKENA
jgi:putative flippase GtrA